jgi:uncharacterized protein (DUF427 family)
MMHRMAKAVWNGVTIAESDDVLLVEFAVYFPFDSLAPGAVRESIAPSTYCHWKGVAKYYDVIVDGDVNEGAAWAYDEPYEGAAGVAGRIAFWKGVEVEGKPDGDPLTDPGGPKGSRTGYEALCWLLVRTEEKSLGSTLIEDETGLSGDALASALEHNHVKPYTRRHGWSLVDGGLARG